MQINFPNNPAPTILITDKLFNFKKQLFNLSHNLLLCNSTNVCNILVQMLFALYSVGYFCHFDIDKLFTEIHRSNMSKLCNSEREAIDTVNWYASNNKQYTSPSYFQAIDEKHWIVFDKSSDKRLKSIKYSSPWIDTAYLRL